jgi:hypothetical protein
MKLQPSRPPVFFAVGAEPSTRARGVQRRVDRLRELPRGAMHDVGSISRYERLSLLLRPAPIDALLPFDGLLTPTNSVPGILAKRVRAPPVPPVRRRYDMGQVSTLTRRERDDLAAYLRTL